MRKRMRAMVGLALALAGCAGGDANLPRPLETGRDPRFPPERFITGVGSSSEGRSAAEVQARAEVCQQVRSRIEATSEDETVFVARGGRSETLQRFVQKAVQTTQCAFAERIRVVPELAAQRSGTYFAFAVLDREDALQALRPEFEQHAAVFRDRARAAIAEAADPVAFTADYNEAMPAFERALPRGLEIRSVAGGAYQPLAETYALLASLLQEASAVRSRIVVGVAVEEAPDRAGLTEAIARWVRAAGVRTVAGPGPAGGLTLRASGQEECSMRVGVCCEWTVQASLCEASGSRCAPVSAPGAEACDRRDREAARARLLEQYGGADAARTARAALSQMVPMPPE